VHHDYSGGVTKTAIISSHREIIEHKEKMKSAQGKLREARKRAEESGIDGKAYDLAMSLMKLDPTEAVTRLNRAYYILKQLQAPVGSQLTFVDMVTDNSMMSDDERAKRWYQDGFHAGANGKWRNECPHMIPSPAYDAWDSGWNDAQKELAGKFKPIGEEPPAPTAAAPDAPAPDASAPEPAKADAAAGEPEAPRRRGRPPGTGGRKSNKGTAAADASNPPDAGTPPSPDEPPTPDEPTVTAEAAPPVPDEDEEVPFGDPDETPPAPPEFEGSAGAFVH
jgi:ribosome modulation factor